MSEAYLIAASQGQVNPFSTLSYAEQVLPVIRSLMEKSGVPLRRVQELHWFGGPEELWFSALAQKADFAPDLVRFQWPAEPILSHSILQSVSRAIELGERDLVLLVQHTGDQAIGLLFASPVAVGRHNLAPRARIALRLAVSRQPDGFLKDAQAAIEKSELENKDVQRFASPARFTAEEMQTVFTTAQLLSQSTTVPAGDFFLLDALVQSLEETDASLGLLLSPAPNGVAVATLVERT